MGRRVGRILEEFEETIIKIYKHFNRKATFNLKHNRLSSSYIPAYIDTALMKMSAWWSALWVKVLLPRLGTWVWSLETKEENLFCSSTYTCVPLCTYIHACIHAQINIKNVLIKKENVLQSLPLWNLLSGKIGSWTCVSTSLQVWGTSCVSFRAQH